MTTGNVKHSLPIKQLIFVSLSNNTSQASSSSATLSGILDKKFNYCYYRHWLLEITALTDIFFLPARNHTGSWAQSNQTLGKETIMQIAA